MAAKDPRRIPDPYPASVSEARRRGLELFLHCPSCRRVAQLFSTWLDRMIGQHGDMTIDDLARRGRCQDCGHRGCRVEAEIRAE